jgi:hypothetical protein
MMSFFTTVYAACDPIIGCVTPPSSIKTLFDSNYKLVGLIAFMNTILKFVFIVAGLYAFFNIIIAGFGFMTAGGDPKQFTKAWDRIWQTLLGLFIIVISFLFAALMGLILFGDPTALLQLKLSP